MSSNSNSVYGCMVRWATVEESSWTWGPGWPSPKILCRARSGLILKPEHQVGPGPGLILEPKCWVGPGTSLQEMQIKLSSGQVRT
jgi:hypothetical protein